jgi:hypothetical protein
MKRNLMILIAVLAMLMVAAAVRAQGVPWSDHTPPFDFRFGNHIDMFQQTRLVGQGNIQGFFYIHFTGMTVNGLPEADHGQDSVGWLLQGVPVTARLIAHSPVTWCIDQGDVHEGFLLKLTATQSFFFMGHGGVPVTPGLDVQSHQNVVSGCL